MPALHREDRKGAPKGQGEPMSIEVTVLLVFLTLLATHLGFLALGFVMGLKGRKTRFIEGVPVFPDKDDIQQQAAHSEPFEDPYQEAQDGPGPVSHFLVHHL